MLAPITVPSLKDAFVQQIEALILDGKLTVGETLPSERELALQLGVSRPVVHDGLMDLAAKGFVTIKPRVGTVVNDYRKEGSLAVLSTLINRHGQRPDSAVLESMLSFRQLVEGESARLAASNRTERDILELRRLLQSESEMPHDRTDDVVRADFALHHQVALASGNMIYPMLLRSFEPAYTSLTSLFFSRRDVVVVVFASHHELVAAIEDQNVRRATTVMKRILAHGAEVLREELAKGADSREERR